MIDLKGTGYFEKMHLRSDENLIVFFILLTISKKQPDSISTCVRKDLKYSSKQEKLEAKT